MASAAAAASAQNPAQSSGKPDRTGPGHRWADRLFHKVVIHPNHAENGPVCSCTTPALRTTVTIIVPTPPPTVVRGFDRNNSKFGVRRFETLRSSIQTASYLGPLILHLSTIIFSNMSLPNNLCINSSLPSSPAALDSTTTTTSFETDAFAGLFLDDGDDVTAEQTLECSHEVPRKRSKEERMQDAVDLSQREYKLAHGLTESGVS